LGTDIGLQARVGIGRLKRRFWVKNVDFAGESISTPTLPGVNPHINFVKFLLTVFEGAVTTLAVLSPRA
jgi:hypothetical protein